MGRRGELDVAPFREAILKEIEGGTTWSELCFRIGYTRTDKSRPSGRSADTTRLQRLVGCREDISHGKRHFRGAISYETAVKIVKALERDPVDFGV